VGSARRSASDSVLLPRKTAGSTPGATFPPLALLPAKQEPSAHRLRSRADSHRFQSSWQMPRVRFGRMAEAILIEAATVALKPLLIDLRQQPIRSHFCRHIEGVAQRFPAHSRRFKSRIAASTCASVGAWRPRALSQPRLLHRSSKACSRWVTAPPVSRRVRNSVST
jgi:hypothetical protein